MSDLLVSRVDSVLPSPLLVVEDEAVMRERQKHILRQLGYRDDALLFASTIGEARALLQEEPVAMALVDVGLPDGCGIDLIAEMHAGDPSLPILVISSWSTETIIVGALQAGATGYLLKERDDVEILVSIRSALRGGAPIDPFVARYILHLFGQTSERQAGAVALPISSAPLNEVNAGGRRPEMHSADGAAALVAQTLAGPDAVQAEVLTIASSEEPVAPSVNYAVVAAAVVASTERASVLSKRERQILGAVGEGLSNREIAERLALSKLTVECHIKNIYKKLAVSSRTAALREAGLILKE
ncbi:hypothetical protein WM40_20990 [Robbsia andropogonis]|uniref:LuxR family transcriptional regulator n=1 Tax=Robbsia andropogonis TaxID=28092 RepID=A0A0F5JVA1_9BURK|nr:response regulator transcription factor [Robbsia andropogonis]KKB61798.1 hypothetical protein WM40_20990 [Robbsia andropogonis]